MSTARLTARVRKSTNYLTYVRERSRVRPESAVKKEAISPAAIPPVKHQELEIEDYLLTNNRVVDDHDSLKHNRRRSSLFRKTVSTPYRSRKTTEKLYRPETAKLQAKVQKKLIAKHKRRKKVNYKLVASLAVLLVLGVGTQLISSRVTKSSKTRSVRLFDDTMTVSGAPIDISKEPQVLSAQVTPNNPNKMPKKILIPSLGLNSEIEPVGLHNSGKLAQPNNAKAIGWYRFSAPPGENSTVLLSGYRFKESAPLSQAEQLRTGDVVELINQAGSSFWYNVKTIDFYAAGKVPMNSLMTTDEGDRVVIVINNGTILADSGEYSERVVIVAELNKN